MPPTGLRDPLVLLRERREDILPIAEAFLEELGPDVGRPAAGISRQAHEALLSYPWPGNVRELRNALERATILRWRPAWSTT